MPAARRIIIDVAIMAGIGIVLALLGPFGTFAAPFAIRLLYWLTLMLAGYVIFLPAMTAATRSAQRLALPEPAMWAAACVLATVPMAAVVHAVTGLLRRHGPLSLDYAAALYGNVLIVGALACLVVWFVRHRRIAPASDTPPPPSVVPSEQPPAVPFLDRLPPHLGRELRALEMEDHYVRAHTAHGSAMILMRMRDAVAELEGLEGAQVHRSWWVARAAVTGVGRDGRNVRLRLGDTLEAPVARATVGDLEARGWF